MVATPSPDGGREASPALRAADAEAPPTPAVVRAPAPAFRVITVADECQTCSAHPREIRCLPCRHQATCEVCTARHFIAEAGRGHSPPWCPFCRAGVDMVDRAVADQDRAMAEQHAPASARKEDAASSASKVEPETRRVLTFRPDPPSDTAESVGAFLERMQRTPAGLELSGVSNSVQRLCSAKPVGMGGTCTCLSHA